MALPFANEVQILPPGSNRPGTLLRGFHACVAHETDNEAASAGAQMHHDWLVNARPEASFHLVADGGVSIQLLPIAPGAAEVGWHIGDGADQPDDESMFTVGGEICVNSRNGYPHACRRMARCFAAVLVTYGRQVVDGDTLRMHGSYWSLRNQAVHRGCPKHLKAGDWGVSWQDFVGMVQAEWTTLAQLETQTTDPGKAEAAALQSWALANTTEAGRGALMREGVADLRQFGGTATERICVYERIVAHRLAAKNYVLTLDLWDSLRRDGKITLY